MKFRQGCIFLWIIVYLNAYGAPPSQQHDAPSKGVKHLKVGVVTRTPFVFYKNGKLTGIAYSIWEAITADQGFHNDYVQLQSISEALDKVHNGQLDAAIGQIPFNSDIIKRVSFTLPLDRGVYILLAKKPTMNFLVRFNMIFHGHMNLLFLGLLILYLVYLHLFWFYERKSQPDLNGLTYRKFMSSITWRSTLTKFRPPFFPSRTPTRVMTLIWVTVFSASFFSIFSGLVASVIADFEDKENLLLTLSDLGDKPIATFGDTTPRIAHSLDLNVSYKATTVEDAVAALEQGKVVGAMMLYGPAKGYLVDHAIRDLYISPIQFPHTYQGYIVNPKKNDLVFALNLSYLKLFESGKRGEICQLYSEYIPVDWCVSGDAR